MTVILFKFANQFYKAKIGLAITGIFILFREYVTTFTHYNKYLEWDGVLMEDRSDQVKRAYPD